MIQGWPLRPVVLLGLFLPASGAAVHAAVQTTRVSTSIAWIQANNDSLAPAISRDGRYAAFQSSATNLAPDDTNGAADIFVYDAVLSTVERVSLALDGAQANGPSLDPAISADGRHVAFSSTASNLLPRDSNGASDVFVRDTITGATERVSVASDGTEANGGSFSPSISADGRYVAFSSLASNLLP